MAPNKELSDFSAMIAAIKITQSQGKCYGSHRIALTTLKILEKLISERSWTNAKELVAQIKAKMTEFTQAIPYEVSAPNVMRHILKIVRKEQGPSAEHDDEDDGDDQSLHSVVNGHHPVEAPVGTLKSRILDHLTEYKEELETSVENVATQAPELVHANEIILTWGHSRTVEEFLKYASKKRPLQVIIVEGEPNLTGHRMAANLSKRGIETTIISDAAIHAVMSRVNKVIIGTNCVMADGSLRGPAGAYTVAMCADAFSVPVIALTHMYKVTPVYRTDVDEIFRGCGSPGEILPSTEDFFQDVEAFSPLFDYIPSRLVKLIVTHRGANDPAYVYHLVAEWYHRKDYL